MRHGFDAGAQFRVRHGAGEVLQDHPARRGGEAVLEHFDVLAAAAADIDEEYAAALLVLLCSGGGLEAVEDLLLDGEPVGEFGTVLAAGRHEGVEVAKGLGVLFNVVPEGEVRTQGVLQWCGARVGRAFIPVFLKIGGHFG